MVLALVGVWRLLIAYLLGYEHFVSPADCTGIRSVDCIRTSAHVIVVALKLANDTRTLVDASGPRPRSLSTQVACENLLTVDVQRLHSAGPLNPTAVDGVAVDYLIGLVDELRNLLDGQRNGSFQARIL